mgnify:CR=1 FL=1
MRSDERSLRSMVLKEIENQIEDKVVPVISSIMGSGRARERDRDSKSRLESYENGEESPQYSDSTNERNPDLRIPYIQDEKGFI